MEQSTIVLSCDSALVGWQVVDANDEGAGRGTITSTRTVWALNNYPFQYNITINNQNTTEVNAWVRIFIVPAYHANDYKKWIETDKFQVKLKANQRNEIKRNSHDSSIIQTLSNDPWVYGEDDGHHSEDKDPYCRCGLPENLLLPRGKREGQKYILAVSVTLDDKPSSGDSCCRASSYCGSDSKDYPDALPLGYPIDRPFPKDKKANQIIRPWLDTKRSTDSNLISTVASILETPFKIKYVEEPPQTSASVGGLRKAFKEVNLAKNRAMLLKVANETSV